MRKYFIILKNLYQVTLISGVNVMFIAKKFLQYKIFTFF